MIVECWNGGTLNDVPPHLPQSSSLAVVVHLLSGAAGTATPVGGSTELPFGCFALQLCGEEEVLRLATPHHKPSLE